MLRATFAVTLVALLAATMGCRMGENPLDCCGPVYCGGTHPPCAQDVRAGSILSPAVGPEMQPTAAEGEVVPESESPQAELTPAPPPRSEPAPQSPSEPQSPSPPSPSRPPSPFVPESSQPQAWQPAASSDGWVPCSHAAEGK